MPSPNYNEIMETLRIIKQAISKNSSIQQQEVFIDTVFYGPCTNRTQTAERCRITYQSLVSIIHNFVAHKIFSAEVKEKSIIKWDINLKQMPDDVVIMIKEIRRKQK